MKPLQVSCVALLLASADTGIAQAQSSPSASQSALALAPTDNGIPITQLIATIQNKTGKKFLIDPRVHGDIDLFEKDLAAVSYSDFLTILQVYNFSAFEFGGYVEVLPLAKARQVGGTMISGNEKRPDAQIVTKVLSAKSLSVVQLVPLLRPMIPRYGHLVALPCVNKLIMVDTFANVRRIESVIDALDIGKPFKPEKCESHLSEHP